MIRKSGHRFSDWIMLNRESTNKLDKTALICRWNGPND
jgi:hypothetical protein